MAARRTALALALLVTLSAGSAGIVEIPLEGEAFQAYDGKALPLRKVARVEVSARTGATVELVKVNGREVPPGTVRSRIHRGRLLLQQMLREFAP